MRRIYLLAHTDQLYNINYNKNAVRIAIRLLNVIVHIFFCSSKANLYFLAHSLTTA
jgi:hypothetical protein